MGLDVDDVEPYPSNDREAPTYGRYEDIDNEYDVIISNAVLNVIPDDWRADVLKQMASKLRVGGKKYYDLTDKVRVRFADHQGNADTFARVRPRRGGAFGEVNKIETLFPKYAKGIVN